jgi:hypothetical protein
MDERIAKHRLYYAKRVGWRWEVWWCHEDRSADPYSGATEWRVGYQKYLRWVAAARHAQNNQCAYDAGVWHMLAPVNGEATS